MQKGEKFDKITPVKGMQIPHIGDSPSGKATDSDSVIRVFESLRPSQKYTVYCIKGGKPCIFVYFSLLRIKLWGRLWGKLWGKSGEKSHVFIVFFHSKTLNGLERKYGDI